MAKVLIIAEAGVNHNGNTEMAKKLVDVAAEATADFVKFQTFKAENITSKFASKAEYQKKATSASETQFEMLKKLELSYEDHLTLIDYCKKKSIQFLSTPFDLESIDLLRQLGVKLGKIPSGEITNLPYLQKMAENFDELIMSTGMADMKEISEAINAIIGKGFSKDKLTILHCNTEYPTPYIDVNLKAMQTIAEAFDVKVGYSDHTNGIEVPVAAVALGASVVEKHFTLDRNLEGPDHRASLEPEELRTMVIAIRNIEKAMGDGIKRPSASELKNKLIARKSLVAKKNLPVGHTIQLTDITTKRPGNGISPMLINNIIGKQLIKALLEDEVLTYGHFDQ
jgi:N,N'-diacetyllegionaminate synthase